MKKEQTNSTRSIFLIMTLCMIFSGCTKNSAWRTDFSEKESNKCNETCIIEKHENFDLGFIEFSDKGNLFNNKPKDIILEKIDGYSKSKERVTVVVFVHGWLHNAASDDGNVMAFREAMKKVSNAIKEKTPDKHVFGLYIGWRGLSLHDGFGLLEKLTFWDRKSVAEEIGKGGVTQVLLELDMMAKRNEKDTLDKNTLIIAGHSFGGAIVLSALNEIILDRMIQMKYNSRDNKSTEFIPLGDEVVLLNPAIEANQIEQLFELGTQIADSTDSGEIDNLERKKLLSIITTSADVDTKYAFYAGQFIDNIFTSHSEVSRDYSREKIDERGLEFTAAGHYKPFHTGNLIDIDASVALCSEGESDSMHRSNMPSNESMLIDKWKYMSCCKCAEGCLVSNKKGKTTLCSEEQDNFPISLLYSDESFMKNHNDVFNNKVIAFLASGATGSTMRKLRIDNQEPDKVIKVIPEQCIKNAIFNFSQCFDYYMNKFK